MNVSVVRMILRLGNSARYIFRDILYTITFQFLEDARNWIGSINVEDRCCKELIETKAEAKND